MKNLVIFASNIPNKNKLNIGESILDLVSKHIPNNNIYIGVNDSDQSWLDIVSRYNHNITPKELLVRSDASAYQSALRGYVNSNDNIEYDNVFFLHTQGTKSGRHSVREFHLDNLVKNYNEAIEKLYHDEKYGIYGATFSPVTRFNQNIVNDNKGIWYTLDKYYNFPYCPFPYFYIGTMFIIKFKILKEFLNNCNKSFFSEKLTTVHTPKNTDLWFFERDFPQVIFRQGYLPTYKCLYNNYGLKNFNEEEYLKDLIAWKKQNNLSVA